MRVGILGTGDVGRFLGTGFVNIGYEVKIGSRKPNQEKVKNWLEKSGSLASAGTFSEAADFGDFIVLATNWTGTENAIRLADPKNFSRKVVIDITNPLDFSKGMPPKLAVGHSDSAGEQIQRWLPNAYVVKAFNSIGHPHMINPKFPDGPPDMFICGNNDESKQFVAELLKVFGWSVIDIGGIDCARYLEPLAMIWILYFFKTNTGNHAFKLLRK